jgi:hypothetical protein
MKYLTLDFYADCISSSLLVPFCGAGVFPRIISRQIYNLQLAGTRVTAVMIVIFQWKTVFGPRDEYVISDVASYITLKSHIIAA